LLAAVFTASAAVFFYSAVIFASLAFSEADNGFGAAGAALTGHLAA